VQSARVLDLESNGGATAAQKLWQAANIAAAAAFMTTLPGHTPLLPEAPAQP
jgi:hypothetical protein